MTKPPAESLEAISRSLGVIRSKRELQANLWLGAIEYPTGRERSCIIRFCPGGPIGAGDELAQRRFTTEALLGLDISRGHINLLSTLHFGTWEDGRLFQAFEWVAGRTVAELRGQLGTRHDLVETIARGVLRALRYVHRCGVVHGGVAPGNVLIGSDGVIRLGDLSRARRAAPDRLHPGEILAAGIEDLRALGRLLFDLVTDQPTLALVGDPSVEAPTMRPDDLPDDLPGHLPDHLPGHLPGHLPTNLATDLATLIRHLHDPKRELSAEAALALLGERAEPLIPTPDLLAMVEAQDAGPEGPLRDWVMGLDSESQQLLSAVIDLLEGKLTDETDADADVEVAHRPDRSLHETRPQARPLPPGAARPAVPDVPSTVLPQADIQHDVSGVPRNYNRILPLLPIAVASVALIVATWGLIRPPSTQDMTTAPPIATPELTDEELAALRAALDRRSESGQLGALGSTSETQQQRENATESRSTDPQTERSANPSPLTEHWRLEDELKRLENSPTLRHPDGMALQLREDHQNNATGRWRLHIFNGSKRAIWANWATLHYTERSDSAEAAIRLHRQLDRQLDRQSGGQLCTDEGYIPAGVGCDMTVSLNPESLFPGEPARIVIGDSLGSWSISTEGVAWN